MKNSFPTGVWGQKKPPPERRSTSFLQRSGKKLIVVGIAIGIFQYFTLPFLMKDVGIPSLEQLASWFLIPALFLLTGFGLLMFKELLIPKDQSQF